MNLTVSDAKAPVNIFIFLCGLVVGAVLLGTMIPNDIFVTQEMALTALEKRCVPGEAWEYRTPNPKTNETLLIIQCNPTRSTVT